MNEQDKNKSLAAVVLFGLATFLYQFADILIKIQTWEIIWNPPTVGHMVIALASALGAVAAAIKLDVTKVFE